MNTETLDKRIVGTHSTQGWNWDSDVGNSHNSSADKRDPKLLSKENMTNGELDVRMPKTGNPGVDKSFLAKGNPQSDTTGHGILTRPCCD